MSRHTTFRIGGAADFLVHPKSVEDVKETIALTKKYNVPLTILGNGSNILVGDRGIRGIVMSFDESFADMRCDGEKIIVGAGAVLGMVSQFAAKNSLSGLEFAVGIPGSMGGAVFMNAGAYDGEMSNVITSVKALSLFGELKTYRAEEIGFSYRHSIFQGNGEIIVEIELTLKKGDEEAIKEKMAGFSAARLTKQPLEMPSAGSTFKRPEGYFAGTLIDNAGLKGLSVGGAQVSEKHAGFIVNKGGATASDVLALIERVREIVAEKFGVTLTPEVRIIGEMK